MYDRTIRWSRVCNGRVLPCTINVCDGIDFVQPAYINVSLNKKNNLIFMILVSNNWSNRCLRKSIEIAMIISWEDFT